MKISLVVHPDGLHPVHKGKVARLRRKRDVQSKKLETRIWYNTAPGRKSTPTGTRLQGQGGNGMSSPKSWKREFVATQQQATIPYPRGQVPRPRWKRDVHSIKLETRLVNSMEANKSSTHKGTKLRGQCGKGTSSRKSWKPEFRITRPRKETPDPQGPSCQAKVETGCPVQKVGNANWGQHGHKSQGAKLRGQCENVTSSPKSRKRDFGITWPREEIPHPQGPGGRSAQRVGSVGFGQRGLGRMRW